MIFSLSSEPFWRALLQKRAKVVWANGKMTNRLLRVKSSNRRREVSRALGRHEIHHTDLQPTPTDSAQIHCVNLSASRGNVAKIEQRVAMTSKLLQLAKFDGAPLTSRVSCAIAVGWRGANEEASEFDVF